MVFHMGKTSGMFHDFDDFPTLALYTLLEDFLLPLDGFFNPSRSKRLLV